MDGMSDETTRPARRRTTGPGSAGDGAEPRRDARLASALRHAAWMERDDPAALDALRERIVAAAARPLARRRAAAPAWWEWTAGWARTAIPLGLAAAALLGVVAWWGARPARAVPAAEPPATIAGAPARPVAATVVMAAVITETEADTMVDQLLGAPAPGVVLSGVLQ
ncbi:MAG TPA: hypothetical protein VFS08_10675 [Gemmatimonadaceae bacterium]|nr:hypothetical protein [Gemmatimonadaceae bacterium]